MPAVPLRRGGGFRFPSARLKKMNMEGVSGISMARLSNFVAVFGAFLLLMSLSVSAQYGYGTSIISVSPNPVSVAVGAAAIVNYTVNLASGSTWGTNLVVVNQTQLAAQGITLGVSNPSGDPPFSGQLMIITTSSVAPRSYGLVLRATGDDPSASDVILMVNVASPATTSVAPTTTAAATTTAVNATNATTTAPVTTQQTSVPTTVPATTTVAPVYYPPSNNLALYSSALIAVIAIAAAGLMLVKKSAFARLVFAGAALILIGTVAWLYGDYAGGLMQYIWGGVAAIILGIIVLAAGRPQGRGVQVREARCAGRGRSDPDTRGNGRVALRGLLWRGQPDVRVVRSGAHNNRDRRVALRGLHGRRLQEVRVAHPRLSGAALPAQKKLLAKFMVRRDAIFIRKAIGLASGR